MGTADSSGRAAVGVRLASPEDSDALASLRRAWVEEQHGGPVDDPAFEGDFLSWFAREDDVRVTWLAESEGMALGMVNLRVFDRMPRPGRAPSQWGYLSNFFVRAEHRGIGIGRGLLEHCVRYADDHGFVRLVLSPSELSVPLYVRAGFGPATALLVRDLPEAGTD